MDVSSKESSFEAMADFIAKYGDFHHRRFSELKKVDDTIFCALRGDHDSIYAFSALAYEMVGGSFAANMFANLAIMVGKDVPDGAKVLSHFFFGYPSPLTGDCDRKDMMSEWCLTLCRTLFHSFEFSLRPMIYENFKSLFSFLSYYSSSTLRDLLLDSAVRRAMRFKPFDLKLLYDFFVKKGPNLDLEVYETLADMAQYGLPFHFRTTRVEPSVLFLSFLLEYCRLNGRFDLKPLAPGDLTGGYQIEIELTDRLILEVWENLEKYKPSFADYIRKAIGYVEKMAKTPVKPCSLEYYDYKCLAPYAAFFRQLEDASTGRPEALDAVLKGLTQIAVPFMSYIFPFIDMSTDGRRTIITIRGETKEDALMLMEALASTSHLSATYAVQLLYGIHAWKLLKLGKAKIGLDGVFERTRTVGYWPFLPPEEVVRHSFLFAGSILFKIMDALLQRVVDMRYRSVFAPTGNFEKDLLRLWRMASLEGQLVLESSYEIRDVEGLLRLVDRESYNLFARLQKLPLEWLSVAFIMLLRTYETKLLPGRQADG
jgi:hypothetical protein